MCFIIFRLKTCDTLIRAWPRSCTCCMHTATAWSMKEVCQSQSLAHEKLVVLKAAATSFKLPPSLCRSSPILYKAGDRVHLALRSLQNRRWTGYLSKT